MNLTQTGINKLKKYSPSKRNNRDYLLDRFLAVQEMMYIIEELEDVNKEVTTNESK